MKPKTPLVYPESRDRLLGLANLVAARHQSGRNRPTASRSCVTGAAGIDARKRRP
jgi:hypothetical protein